MIWKVLLVAGVALSVTAQEHHKHAVSEQKVIKHIVYGHHGDLGHIGEKPVHHEEYAYAYPKYEFAYQVSDPHTGDHKGQEEHRDGDKVHGNYWLIQPDGKKRIVKYHGDAHSGFHADVIYEHLWESKHDEKEHQHHISHYPVVHHEVHVKHPEHHEHKQEEMKPIQVEEIKKVEEPKPEPKKEEKPKQKPKQKQEEPKHIQYLKEEQLFKQHKEVEHPNHEIELPQNEIEENHQELRREEEERRYEGLPHVRHEEIHEQRRPSYEHHEPYYGYRHHPRFHRHDKKQRKEKEVVKEVTEEKQE